jgi:RNA polymerase sigma-70 factor (ECF subfamily)
MLCCILWRLASQRTTVPSQKFPASVERRNCHAGNFWDVPLVCFCMELCWSEVPGIGVFMAARDTEEQKQALFTQWALPHKDYLYTSCLYLTRQRDDAEDLFQETYLRAFRFFHQFTPGTNCRAWLLTIMHNVFKKRYRHYQRATQTLEFDLAAHEYEKKRLADGEARRDDPAELLLSQLVDSEITNALQTLPEEYRSTLVLIDIEELTYEEAAAVLGCPIGTIRSRLSRARRLLRASLTAYAQEHGYGRDKKPRSEPAEALPKTGTKL